MKLTDAEWTLMNSLWRKQPATAREISDSLPQTVGWAYTTIKTMLDRLVQKGALREWKKGVPSVYSPLVTRRAARSAALTALADQAFDGAFGPLVHFLIENKKLSARERKSVRKALKKGGKK